MSPTLLRLIEKARLICMTPQERAEQRISFAFGNANYEDQRVTRKDVERSSDSSRGNIEAHDEPMR
jgi:hypothetical protein